jgi:hypothetical protein
MERKIRRHSLHYYTQGSIPILLVVVGIDIIWTIAGKPSLVNFLGDDTAYLFPWIIRIVGFISVGWLFGYRHNDTPWNAAKAGALGGLSIGLIIGLFEVMWYHNLNALLLMLALPWQTLLMGMLVSWGSAHIFSTWAHENNDYLKVKKSYAKTDSDKKNIE